MTNPFKNNSLASGLFGFILGLATFGGGQAIYDANSEPEVLYQTPNGLMAVVPQQQTNGVVEKTEEKQEQTETTKDSQNNQNSWRDHPPYKGLTDNPNGDVVVTKSGEKYHKSFNCSGLRNANNPIRVDKNDAINAGFGPCKRCY